MSNLAAYIASLGAVDHWRLGESGNHIAISETGNKPLYWTAVPTQVDGLVNLDDNYAQELSAAGHIAKGTPYADVNNFSVSFVIENKNMLQVGWIVANGDTAGGTNGWAIAIHNGAFGAGFQLCVTFNGVIAAALALRTLELHAKYFIVFVRRAGTNELWVNGLLHDSSATYAPLAPTTNFVIGNTAIGGANYLRGIVDEVAYFQTALSEASIVNMSKLVWAIRPGVPVFSVGDNGAGGDTFALSTAAVAGSFPLGGYALWESTSNDEDSFEFSRPPLATIAPAGTFAARTAQRGRYYALCAFDDRNQPNYGPPQILASVAVPLTDADAVRKAVGLESANLAWLVNAVVGKNNVTDNGDGTFDIEVPNSADNGTLGTTRFNPTTGVKTVV